MNNALVLCILTAMFWATAPLVGRLSSLNAMWMVLMIGFGSFIVVLPVIFTQNYSELTSRGVTFGLVAGVLNGLGMITFYLLVGGSNKGLWELSKVAPITYVLVPIGVVIGAKVLFGEAFTMQKVFGVGLACGAIWLLK